MDFIALCVVGFLMVMWLGSGAMAYAVVAGAIVGFIVLWLCVVSEAHIIAKIIGGAIIFGTTGLVVRAVFASGSKPSSTDPYIDGLVGLVLIAISVIVGGIIIMLSDEMS